MRFVSLRWKLSGALIALTLSVVLIYIFLTVRVFKSDKISYVFDFQQMHSNSVAKSISQRFDRAVWDARALLSAYDPQTHTLNAVGRGLFSAQNVIEAVWLLNSATHQTVAHLEKKPTVQPSLIPTRPGVLSVQGSTPDHYLLTLGEKALNVPDLTLQILIYLPDLLAQEGAGNFTLSADGQILTATGKASQFQNFIAANADAKVSTTSIQKINGENFLVSAVQLPFGNLQLMHFISEATALSSLDLLYRQSIYFLMMTVAFVASVALILARGLTSSLSSLTRNAEVVGSGQFEGLKVIHSNDEIGILAVAFDNMKIEIEQLLLQAKDKTRMEGELQIARLVQESLMPEAAEQQFGNVALAGVSMSSTECGGDWWYSFAIGTKLHVVVADATGHGTPAALITSATRAVFSVIEQAPLLTLAEMATLWDYAIISCSKRKMLMTGYILRIDVETGECEALNASHELPMLIKPVLAKDMVSFIATPPNWTLGEYLQKEWDVCQFRIEEGESLLLFSDGLFSVTDVAGELVSEGRVLRMLKETIKDEGTRTPARTLRALVHKIDLARGQAPLADDLTAVFIRRG